MNVHGISLMKDMPRPIRPTSMKVSKEVKQRLALLPKPKHSQSSIFFDYGNMHSATAPPRLYEVFFDSQTGQALRNGFFLYELKRDKDGFVLPPEDDSGRVRIRRESLPSELQKQGGALYFNGIEKVTSLLLMAFSDHT
jgi:hypothetical protein